MKYRIILQVVLVTLFAGLAALSAQTKMGGIGAESSPLSSQGNACDISFPLPNASEIGVNKFEKRLYAFLEKGCYKSWKADSQIRNTGPFISTFLTFDTHTAVKVYYSPQIWDWLKNRNRQGEIPDGAMIVKVMFPPPARQDAELSGWTVMVKDKKGSFDGWFWSYHGKPQTSPQPAPENPEIGYPD